MPLTKIKFFFEDIVYNLSQKSNLRSWISQVIKEENKKLDQLNFIFCNDTYLLDINRKYLNHNNYTDIITFDNSSTNGLIIGDIFISIDRVIENALKFKVSETDELHRVIIHGTLHLLSYKDKTKADKAHMTGKENYYLAQRKF